MPIGDYCQRPAATVLENDTARSAAQRMKLSGVGSLVVVRDGRPVGIVTDRDLALETICNRLDAGAVRVGELASRSLVTVHADAPVREAVRLMGRRGVRRLPVVDDKGEIVGIVAADDLATLAIAELSGLAVAIGAQAPASDEQREKS
ncbi:MAG TPA: CBS domain-containing protein [Myxococcota bacterium]|nr:CBS domain-containing protein [Myxococcota bacterium]